MNEFNEIHEAEPFQFGTQFGVFKKSVYQISLHIKEHILTTHRELAELRRCSNMLRNKPNRKVHIIAPQQQKQSNYIKKTLIHLGVSCGQIVEVSTLAAPHNSRLGIVLLVENGG